MRQYPKDRDLPKKALDYLLSRDKVAAGVGRGFDFRDSDRRRFADDLAAKDALIKSAKFIKANIERASK
ncbi:hypothetical protein [Thermocrinis sp.]|uniref:hypothetical protein n=1 Tax=Thermocrinis sp. TaxID=2024383 RepID=UPI002FDDFDDB